MKSKTTIAVIGTGGIAGAHLKGILAHQDKIECIALCDVSQENLRRGNELIGGKCALFSDWKQMLSELGDKLDAVDICLPHHLHGQAILDAAAAGKHILCEKPMCINLAEADGIVAAVKKAGIIYMSGHNQLFMPAVQEAKKMIDHGAVGQLRWLRSQDCFRMGGDGKNLAGQWRATVATQGGGELIDTGYHPTYRLLYLAGSEVVRIRGTMGRFEQEMEGEDTASVQVGFANGAIGEILTSWAMNNPYGTHQIHVIGDKGQIFGSENVLYFLPHGTKEPEKKEFPKTETFNAQMGHFADCIRSGNRPPHSVEEGRTVLRVILEASKDAEGWQQYAVKKV